MTELVLVKTEQVYDYCLQLCDILDERFRKEFPTLNNTFTVDKGRKYYRVWAIDNQKSIHCFVILKQEMYLNQKVITNQQNTLGIIY